MVLSLWMTSWSCSLHLAPNVCNFCPWQKPENGKAHFRCWLQASWQPVTVSCCNMRTQLQPKPMPPTASFRLGEPVRLEGGTVVLGSNQENMAYPSGMCGERVAVFAAGAQHPGSVMEAVAIVSPSPKAIADAFMPCGGCRQVLVEAERRQGRAMRCCCRCEMKTS